MVERTQGRNCCNYFNLNLAMARAVKDTPLLGEKVPQDHFNDHKGLCCALQLKDVTSRATGPRSAGLGVDTDESLAPVPVDMIFLDMQLQVVVTEQVRTSLTRFAQHQRAQLL